MKFSDELSEIISDKKPDLSLLNKFYSAKYAEYINHLVTRLKSQIKEETKRKNYTYTNNKKTLQFDIAFYDIANSGYAYYDSFGTSMYCSPINDEQILRTLDRMHMSKDERHKNFPILEFLNGGSSGCWAIAAKGEKAVVAMELISKRVGWGLFHGYNDTSEVRRYYLTSEGNQFFKDFEKKCLSEGISIEPFFAIFVDSNLKTRKDIFLNSNNTSITLDWKDHKLGPNRLFIRCTVNL